MQVRDWKWMLFYWLWEVLGALYELVLEGMDTLARNSYMCGYYYQDF